MPDQNERRVGVLDRSIGTPQFVSDPYAVYARLQVDDPVHWSSKLGGWVVTRYVDVKAILQDSSTFSSEGRQQALLDRLKASSGRGYPVLSEHYKRGGVINSDPPVHTRLRSLINRAFSARTVVALRPSIDRLVGELLDHVGSGDVLDVVGTLAEPMPAIVIAELLGAPAQHRRRFVDWSHDINYFLHVATTTPEVAERAQTAMASMSAYLADMLGERPDEDGSGLLAELARAELDGDVLTEREVLATAVTLLIAGHETTTNLIGNATLALLRNPDQLELLRRHPERIDDAVEEFLRYDSSVHSVKRVVRVDTQLHSVRLGEGDLVFAMIGAANRDPEVFTNPGMLDVGRFVGRTRHVSFGFGIHFCLGAPLARLEAACALEQLVDRFDDLRFAKGRPPVWKGTFALRGLEELAVATGPSVSSA